MGAGAHRRQNGRTASALANAFRQEPQAAFQMAACGLAGVPSGHRLGADACSQPASAEAKSGGGRGVVGMVG